MYRSHEVLPTVPATAPMNTKTGLDPDYTGPVPTMQPKAIAHQDRSDTEKQVVYESQLQVAYEPVAHISMDERYGGLEINPAESRDAISSKKRLLGGNSPRRRKLIILAIGGISVVLIAIIIAVVVAVTTTRKQNGSGGVEPSTSPVPTPSQPSGIPVPKIMAANSSLAAAGWALDTGKGTFSLRVIFQDPNGWLQARTYDSSKSTWANLTNITQAKLGSPLTLTRFDLSIYGGVQKMQGELFYIDKDDDTSLREWNWPDGTDLLRVGESGLMNKEGFQADSTSKMSAYWPFILSQGSDGFLQEVVYGGAGTGPTWNVSNTNTRFETTQILAGSAIAIVPAAQSLNTTNIFYQQTDRTITVYRRYDVKSIYQVDDTYPYKKPLPANAAIAAFSTPSTTKPASDVLNVYSLFQDADGKIQMVWHDDPDSIDNWKGPKTFSAFDGADVGTPIACVTMFTFLSHPMETFRIPRCFFVVGGSIRQVKLVGDDWDIVGLVGEEDE